MSRLIDRIRAEGCQPLRASLFDGASELTDFLKRQILDASLSANKPITSEELERRLQIARTNFKQSEPVSTEVLDIAELEGVPVFAADDVAIYIFSLPTGTNVADVVSSMAPPFNKFFVEFQNIPNQRMAKSEDKLHSWGALITADENPDYITHFEGDDGKPRWILNIDTFIEMEKGKPFGPIAHHIAGLAEDGTWFRHADGNVWWGGGLAKFGEEPPEEVNQSVGDFVANLLFPVLLTISFLHCKNIKLNTITPPEKLSRKYQKRHGKELVRYHVLEIAPLKRLIDKYRTGLKTDLRRALHICRGHFKTFTTDSPLFGHHIGTYWWTPQVRGSKSTGVVLKDYRVVAPADVGRSYREADENPPHFEKETPPAKDPDSVGRGLAAHNKTQNAIAQVVRKFGWIPLSPSSKEPEYDIAWKIKETLYVCEVKSLSASNEERQLRMAIGQVIRYRQKLGALGYEPVIAVIATEVCPVDKSWDDLCTNENIVLLWPEIAEQRLQSAIIERQLV